MLSCTHYPFVEKEIREAFGLGVTILDPAERTVQAAMDDLKQRKLQREVGLGRAEVNPLAIQSVTMV